MESSGIRYHISIKTANNDGFGRRNQIAYDVLYLDTEKIVLFMDKLNIMTYKSISNPVANTLYIFYI